MYRGRSAIIRKRLPCIVKRSSIGRRSATAARSHINWNVLRLLRKLRNRGNGQLNFWAQQRPCEKPAIQRGHPRNALSMKGNWQDCEPVWRKKRLLCFGKRDDP